MVFTSIIVKVGLGVLALATLAQSKPYKQTNRGEVIRRAFRPRALRPRQSSSPVFCPAGGILPTADVTLLDSFDSDEATYLPVAEYFSGTVEIFGQTFTADQFAVSINGGIRIGTTESEDPTAPSLPALSQEFPTPDADDTALAFLWNDLVLGNAGSSITFGFNNDYIVFEWLAQPESDAAITIHAQIIIDRTVPNRVYFKYLPDTTIGVLSTGSFNIDGSDPFQIGGQTGAGLSQIGFSLYPDYPDTTGAPILSGQCLTFNTITGAFQSSFPDGP